MKSKHILWLYISVGLIHLIAIIIGLDDISRYSKSLLMPILIVYVYRSSIGGVTLTTLLMVVGLIFSWGGDIALIYAHEEKYFMIGIGLFLLAQATYIYLFSKAVSHPIKFEWVKAVPFLLYAGILMIILVPKTGDFKIPILIYGICITFMAIMSRMREGYTSIESYHTAMLGAILFVVSDSLIAMDRFVTEIPFSRLLIMGTYISAQLLIIQGVLNHRG